MAQEEGIADEGSHPTAPRGGRYRLPPGLGDEIPADEEVMLEPELVDHAKFPVKPLLHVLGQLPRGTHLFVPLVAFT